MAAFLVNTASHSLLIIIAILIVIGLEINKYYKWIEIGSERVKIYKYSKMYETQIGLQIISSLYQSHNFTWTQINKFECRFPSDRFYEELTDILFQYNYNSAAFDMVGQLVSVVSLQFAKACATFEHNDWEYFVSLMARHSGLQDNNGSIVGVFDENISKFIKWDSENIKHWNYYPLLCTNI